MSRMLRAIIWSVTIALLTFSSVQAQVTPEVNARVIRDFARISFAWPEKMRFRTQQSGNSLTITFEEAANPDLNVITQRLSPYVQQARRTNNGRSVVLTLNNPYKIRQFISGNNTGIDLLGVTEASTQPPPKLIATPEIPAPIGTPTPLAKPKTPQAATQATEWPRVTPKLKPARAQAEPAAEVAEETATPQPNPEPTAQAEAVDTPEEAPKEVASEPETETAAEQPAASQEPETVQAVETPVVEANELRTAPRPTPQDQTVEVMAEANTPEETLIVTIKQNPTGSNLLFPWKDRVASIVFFRENALWIGFNKHVRINTELLQSVLPASVNNIQELDVPGYTLLRMETDGQLHASARRVPNSFEWVITLSNNPTLPTRPVPLTMEAEARTPHIYLPTLEYTTPVNVTDPVVGDTLVLSAFYNSGEGIYPKREFVEFTLLQTAQGLAMLKKDDDAQIVELRNGIRLTSEGGMALSEDLPQLALDELELLDTKFSTLFPYERWKVEPEEFKATEQELMQKLSDATGLRASSLRLKLAQLYLGEGMELETLGVLDRIRRTDPFFYEERKLAALRGAANFLAYRVGEAAYDFNQQSLENIEEIKLWRQASDLFLQRDRARFDFVDFDTAYIKKYPPEMRQRLAVLAADNYINRKSYNKAVRVFDSLSEDGILMPIEPYVDYLLGKVSAETGKIKPAIAIWEKLAESDDRFIRARAAYSLATLQYNEGLIDRDEAIEKLNNLRIVWRGDSLELGLLSQLGQLYIDNGQYLEGLRAWRDVVTEFSDSPVATEIAQNMSETFQYLYNAGGADEMEPLKALALFYEFRELTPIGRAGDKMIQGLADRLASVDLLDRAAGLLDHQVKYRLEGEERSTVGTRLALLHLLNDEPQKALDTLEVTGYGENDTELARQRRHLTATALTELDRPEDAIAILAGDNSPESKIVKLRTYWEMSDWINVIDTGEDILGNRPNLTAPLNKAETETLLRLALAYQFERNTTQLQYLRDYFSPLLPEDSSTKNTFLFITNNQGPIDPQNFQAVSQEIANIETFMQSYRDRVNEGGLSSAIN